MTPVSFGSAWAAAASATPRHSATWLSTKTGRTAVMNDTKSSASTCDCGIRTSSKDAQADWVAFKPSRLKGVPKVTPSWPASKAKMILCPSSVLAPVTTMASS